MRASAERIEALRLGQKRYFTGMPCCKGHVAERLVSSRACCSCALEKSLRRATSEQGKKYLRVYRQREHVRAKRKIRNKAHREAKPEYHRDRMLKWRFGLPAGQYDALLTAQDGRCAICRNLPGEKRLAVDHCHQTGIVRGLLCDTCNRGIGHFRDDPKALRKAAKYLEQHIVAVLEEGSYGKENG